MSFIDFISQKEEESDDNSEPEFSVFNRILMEETDIRLQKKTQVDLTENNLFDPSSRLFRTDLLESNIFNFDELSEPQSEFRFIKFVKTF